MVDLFDSISRRKSCRSYSERPLDKKQLDEIQDTIKVLERLYPDVTLDFRFTAQAKGILKSKAPHYLIISGHGKERELESAGFLFQQLVLWFDAHEIGCIWLGGAKDKKQNYDGKDIITIAFGKSDGAIHRDESSFQRKHITEITDITDNECIRAVRLAPSGINLQPWYFKREDNKIAVYKQLLKPPVSLLYKLTDLDMGIALCHYAVACKHFGKSFNFQRKHGESKLKGFCLFGEISTN